MRPMLIMAACLLLTASATPVAPPATLQVVDVPQDLGAQQAIFQTREFAPGDSSGWHVHPGTEMAYVVSGTVDLVTAGGVRRIGPGDSFLVPRGVRHNGINTGAEPARVVITLVVDKGVAPRQSVAAP